MRRAPRAACRAPWRPSRSRRGAGRRRACEAGLVDVLEEQRSVSVSSRSPSGAAASRRLRWSARRAGLVGAGDRCLSGSSSRPSRSAATTSGTSSRVDRADVDAVDRRHRRDVAGAEALEGADVEVGVVADLVLEARRAARRRRAASTRCSCRRRPCCAPTGLRLEHVVEGRDRDQVAGRQAHDARHLLDGLGRAPAVLALHGGERRDRGAAAVGVLRHVRLDLGAQLLGHRRRRGVGDLRRVLRQVDGLVPAGHARAVRESADLRSRLTGRCRRGPGRASPASRSGRRCRRP